MLDGIFALHQAALEVVMKALWVRLDLLGFWIECRRVAHSLRFQRRFKEYYLFTPDYLKSLVPDNLKVPKKNLVESSSFGRSSSLGFQRALPV